MLIQDLKYCQPENDIHVQGGLIRVGGIQIQVNSNRTMQLATARATVRVNFVDGDVNVSAIAANFSNNTQSNS